VRSRQTARMPLTRGTPASALWLILTALLGVPAPHVQARPVRVHADTVLDGRGAVLRDTTLVIEGSRIVGLESGPAPAADYELGASTLMPGWIDTHVHLASHVNAAGRGDPSVELQGEFFLRVEGTAWTTLQAGFTTVRSVGAEEDKVVRDLIDRGVIPGPRVLTSLTPITDRSGSPTEIREKVRLLVAAGADVIKIFATQSGNRGAPTMTDAQIEAACSEAKVLGRRVAVHAFGDHGARVAILAGGTSIEHGTFLTDATLDLMVARGIYFDPNFSNVRHYLEHQADYAREFAPADFSQMEKDFPIALDTLRRARAKNVKIVFGSDAVFGMHGHNAEEFVQRVQRGGETPMDAIVSATSRAAESLGLQEKIGAIAIGLEADLVATAGNPLGDIESVRRVVFVMRGGTVYKNVAPAQAGLPASSHAGR
jgi:imidazolonepropionase-like amidohydrolase